MFVDLHIHSYFSDGAQTPEQAALACRTPPARVRISNTAMSMAALCATRC